MDYEIRPPLPAEALEWEKLRMVSWREAYAGTFTPEMFEKQDAQLQARATGFAEWVEGTGGTGEDVQPRLGQRRRALVAARPALTLPTPPELPASLGADSHLLTPGGTALAASPETSPLLGLAFASQMPYDVQKLEMLYLHPEAFGTGIAQALLRSALDQGPAELEVLTTNARAIRFYEKEGFTIARTDEFAGRKSYIMTRP
ncbi:GNAT family N-acetyltransferase [Rothia nasimurium]|uniref:GNAT family N-acetyltransferase n=1 Tax=Rothia nasimurium TaxID=85336 RepID=UPI001F47EF85|nr:GNAT family N-acetyltransferase [Rothia nasimurium]